MEEPKVSPAIPTSQTSTVQTSPVEVKKKGNGLKIVIIILAVLFLLCAFCGGAIYLIGKNQVDQAIKNENVIQNFQDLIVDTDQMPIGFPVDQVMFTDDFEIVKAGTNSTSKEWKYSVAYVTSENVNFVKDIYKNKMILKGWKLDSATVISGIDTIILSKANNGLIVTLTDASEDGTTTTVVNVIYTEK